MNPRIAELLAQATDYADATYKYDLSRGYQIQEWDAIRTHQFAHLIIGECIQQLQVERSNPYRNLGDTHNLATSALDESTRRIREHFGLSV